MPNQPVISVGTAMIAAQPDSFFITTLSRMSFSVRLVSKMLPTRSRSDSVHSASRCTWS